MTTSPSYRVSSRGSAASAFLVASIVAATVVVAFLFVPPAYEASVLISFNPSHIQDEWDLLKDQTRAVDFEEQIRSRAVLAPVAEELGIAQEQPSLSREQSLERAVKKLHAALTVERIRQSSVLRLTVALPSADLAAQAADSIALSFIDLTRRQYLARSQEKIDAIEKEIAHIRAGLSADTGKLHAFLNDRGWNDYEAESRAAAARAVAIKRQTAALESFSATTGAVESGEYQDEHLKELIQKLNDIQTRAVGVRSRFKDASPPVEQIAREKKDLEAAIAGYVARQKKLLYAQLASAEAEQKNFMDAAPEYESYQAAIAYAQKRLQSLFDERSALRLVASALGENTSGFGDLQLLDRAVSPEQPSARQRILIIVAAAVAAFLVSFVLIVSLLWVWKHSARQMPPQPLLPVDTHCKPL